MITALVEHMGALLGSEPEKMLIVRRALARALVKLPAGAGDVAALLGVVRATTAALRNANVNSNRILSAALPNHKTYFTEAGERGASSFFPIPHLSFLSCLCVSPLSFSSPARSCAVQEARLAGLAAFLAHSATPGFLGEKPPVPLDVAGMTGAMTGAQLRTLDAGGDRLRAILTVPVRPLGAAAADDAVDVLAASSASVSSSSSSASSDASTTAAAALSVAIDDDAAMDGMDTAAAAATAAVPDHARAPIDSAQSVVRAQASHLARPALVSPVAVAVMDGDLIYLSTQKRQVSALLFRLLRRREWLPVLAQINSSLLAWSPARYRQVMVSVHGSGTGARLQPWKEELAEAPAAELREDDEEM